MMKLVECRKLIFYFAIGFIFLTGCGNSSQTDAKHKHEGTVSEVIPSPNDSRIIAPLRDSEFVTGDKLELVIESQRSTEEIDSVVFFADGKKLQILKEGLSYTWDSNNSRVGKISLRAQVFYSDGTADNLQTVIILKSDIVPQLYTYRVINSFPHDVNAFTQGLVYSNGYLYESTGQYGESSLRKVKLETAEVLRNISLDRELFGEGLCIFEGRLYQITWKNRVGFVYDKETLRLINKIYYQTEGWGLTTDGNKLLMSDGSHYLYFLDPLYFTEISRIEIYDHNGPVANLNELEMINGLVYANIFGTDDIAIFSPETGKVHGYIDLSGILSPQFRHRQLDVLNGIAWDEENNRLFVTGKYWPRLFEIEIRPK